MLIIKNKKQIKQFGFLITFTLPFISLWLLPITLFSIWYLLILFTSTIILLLTIFNPLSLQFPYKVWMQFGNILGFINSRIILGLVFILILQPTSLIMKIFGYDPLKMKLKNEKTFKVFRKNNKIDLNRIF